jgi:hypothetical protein
VWAGSCADVWLDVRADVRGGCVSCISERDAREFDEEAAAADYQFLRNKTDPSQHPDMGSRGGPQAARSRGHPGRPGRQEGLSSP